jgi:hypothetical protein
MAHQLDIMAAEYLAEKKQARLSRLHFLPTTVLNLLGHVGYLPPNDPKHITDIISRSLKSKSISALSSLHRNWCQIEFSELPPELQKAVLEEFKNGSFLTRALRAVISHIPQ